MLKPLFFLLTFFLLSSVATHTCAAASGPQPASQLAFEANTFSIAPAKAEQKKVGLFTKWKQKLVAKAIKNGLLGEGEMTPKQKRWAKWSMILGIGGIVLLFLPTVGFLAIPAAIIALVFGIKSVEGNSNAQGIIGIIAGGLTLLLLILAIALLVAFFASWN